MFLPKRVMEDGTRLILKVASVNALCLPRAFDASTDWFLEVL